MQPITYPQLRCEMQKRLETANAGASKQVLNNLNTALTKYLEELAIPTDAAVGVEFRTSYYKLVSRHLANMGDASRPEKSIRDRKSLLRKWRALFVELTKEHSAYWGNESPFVCALKEVLPQGVSQERLAKQAGIALSTFKRWLSGHVPTTRSLPSVRRLENFLALPAGQLTDFVNGTAKAMQDPSSADRSIPYRENLRKNAALPYRLASVSEALKGQWREFLSYKTTPLSFDLQRSEKGRWSTTPLHPGATAAAKKWFAFTPDNRYVPSASIAWGYTSAYLGWLANHGGGPATTQTLAMLTDVGLIGRYMAWYIQRSGGDVNGGHMRFLQFALTLLHPRTGYLTQQPEFRLTLSTAMSEDEWAARCATAFSKLSTQAKALKRVVTKGRDPNAPAAAVLQLENPMLALQDMLHRLHSSRPTAGTATEAIWGRDVLLIGLMMCSPLRATNLRHLTYRADGTGSLRHRPDGAWELFIPQEHFKNRHGAASRREYRVVLDSGVYRDLELYLKIFRPMLLNGNVKATDYLFVSRRSGLKNQPWQSLNRHVEALTARHLMQCPGTGPHVIRHIVATAIVKATGEYSTAALVLHDEEETVRKAYAHLCIEDGHAKYRKLFPEVFKG